jgi:uncharacterized membrane protein
MGPNLTESVALLLTGVLAGVELAVRWGVRPALMRLDDHAHLQARQALVRRLRVLVPVLMAATVATCGAALLSAPTGPGAPPRWAGTALLAVFVLLSALGTVPLNIQVDGWSPDSPPAMWKATVRRWARLDTLRSSAALLTFGCFLAAAQ